MTVPMSRRRLVLAILLTDRARLLAALVFVAFFFLVVGIVAFAAALLPFGSGPSLAIPIVIFFGLPYGAIVFETLTSLRRSSLRHRAIRITDDAAGALAVFVTDTARRASAPVPKRIWVSHGFDLSVVPHGRDYDLLIGLAVLDVLTADELGALLALTLARSFGGDSLTAGAYRRIQGWIDVALVERTGVNIGAGVAKAIALGCIGFLHADAIISSREARARAETSRLWGAATLDAAMLRPAMYESYARDVFWPALLKRHAANIEPPDAMSQHRSMCRSALPAQESLRRMNRAAAEFERDIDGSAQVDRETWIPASETLAPALQAVLTRAFDLAWRAGITPGWAQLRDAIARSAAEFASIEHAAAAGPLTDHEEVRRLELIEERDGAAVALPLYREWLARHPSNAAATFRTGFAALTERAPDALALLENAMDLDPRYRTECCGLIADELRAQGRESEAQAYRKRQGEALVELEAGLKERADLKSNVPLLPHGLSDREVEIVATHVRSFKMIVGATLVRREVRQFPSIPCLVLAVRFDGWWTFLHSERIDTVLSAAANVPLPVQILPKKASRNSSRPPAVEIYRAVPIGWRARLAGWARKAQLVLVASGIFLVVVEGVLNRDCFPECWDATAVFLLAPVIVAVNALLLARGPDTSARRAVAFVASAFFAGMFFFGGAFVLLFPVALIGLMRTPTSARPMVWALGMAIPAFTLGWLVTTV